MHNIFVKDKTETNGKTAKLRGTLVKHLSKPLKSHISAYENEENDKEQDILALSIRKNGR